MACKDSIFNITHTQNMCLFNMWGEWKVDSSSAFPDLILKPDTRSEVWNFKSTLTYSRTFISSSEKKGEKANYNFPKGYMELTDYTAEGYKLVSKVVYKVVDITTTRVVLMLIPGNSNPDDKGPIVILKKVNH